MIVRHSIQHIKFVIFCFLYILFNYQLSVTAVPIDNGLIDSELVKGIFIFIYFYNSKVKIKINNKFYLINSLECLTNNTVDLVLILDGSGSVGEETFELLRNFVAHLAGRLNVSNTNSHLAVIQYAETPQLEISLNQYTNSFQVIFCQEQNDSSNFNLIIICNIKKLL